MRCEASCCLGEHRIRARGLLHILAWMAMPGIHTGHTGSSTHCQTNSCASNASHTVLGTQSDHTRHTSSGHMLDRHQAQGAQSQTHVAWDTVLGTTRTPRRAHKAGCEEGSVSRTVLSHHLSRSAPQAVTLQSGLQVCFGAAAEPGASWLQFCVWIFLGPTE